MSCGYFCFFFFFKQKTAYEMRISDWSSDVCSSDLWLNAAVPEAIAGPLKPGQGVQATLAAFPGEIISGRVAVILPETQADSRTLTVRIELPNRGGRLRPGMFATVSFGGNTQPGLLVPSEALIRTEIGRAHV